MSEWYGSTISSTYSEFQQDRAGVPRYKMLKVQRPKDLTLKNSDDFTRFAISYGLSVPFGEGDFRATRRPRSQGIGCHWMLLATRTPRTFTTEDFGRHCFRITQRRQRGTLPEIQNAPMLAYTENLPPLWLERS